VSPALTVSTWPPSIRSPAKSMTTARLSDPRNLNAAQAAASANSTIGRTVAFINVLRYKSCSGNQVRAHRGFGPRVRPVGSSPISAYHRIEETIRAPYAIIPRAKIHKATVTDANVEYEGSITIDEP